MSNAWEELENRCYEYLSGLYGDKNEIEPFGKSDSTKPDIRISPTKEKEFYIEVKSGDSQCCQFVLFPNEDNEQFDFSSKNKVSLTSNCQRIIAYMNGLYKTYHRVGKKGIPVNIGTSVLYGLVNDFYSSKNVQFFMTEGNSFIIFPADKFHEYFEIECFYRRKNSDSSEPNEGNNNSEILYGLIDEGISGIVEYKTIGDKLRCFIHTNSKLHKQRMMCEEYTYQFKDNSYSKKIARKKDNVFEIRRLSNTSNPNVICQLSLKKTSQDTDDLMSFENAITT